MKLTEFLTSNQKTPSAFAADLGVSASTITRILNGERRPGLDLLQRIDAGTGGKVTARDFFASTPEAAE